MAHEFKREKEKKMVAGLRLEVCFVFSLATVELELSGSIARMV
jgi:hypothetical protein